MRDIKINKDVFTVRGLRRGELKKLRRENGINLLDLDLKNAEEAQDVVFDLVLSKQEIKKLDGLENRYALQVWQAILKETYGAEDEEKN